jgi:hypothetical protein
MFIDILIADGIANVNLLLEDILLGIFDRIVLPKNKIAPPIFLWKLC